MSKLILTPEDQLLRINQIVAEVKHWERLDRETLCFKPEPGKWSVLEITGHMNSAYRLYESRMDQLLPTLPDRPEGYTRFPARWLQRKLILSFRPQNGERKYKMATSGKFLPEVKAEGARPEDIRSVFDQFFRYQEHLKQTILRSREKDVSRKKINSAIGPVVRFYLPEAFDFLISHEERHLQQGREVLEENQSLPAQTGLS